MTSDTIEKESLGWIWSLGSPARVIDETYGWISRRYLVAQQCAKHPMRVLEPQWRTNPERPIIFYQRTIIANDIMTSTLKTVEAIFPINDLTTLSSIRLPDLSWTIETSTSSRDRKSLLLLRGLFSLRRSGQAVRLKLLALFRKRTRN
jgi:hypothetical protein